MYNDFNSLYFFLFLVGVFSSESQQLICTGGAIATKWVVTTATCLSEAMTIEGIIPKTKHPRDIYVVIGIPHLSLSDVSDSRVVKRIVIYPKFKSKYEFNVGFVEVC